LPAAVKKPKKSRISKGIDLFRRPWRVRPTLLVLGLSVVLQPYLPLAHATASTKPPAKQTALGGFVKDRALAQLLGEALFRDTVTVMSEPANQTAASVAPPVVTSPASQTPASGQSPAMARDNSAVAQVARNVLAHQTLDKYLWLIQHAYDDSMWKGGDRARIEQHFPLIWRTSIMFYEASLGASPHRVRVCAPADNGDGFDCRDEISRTRIVPIPAQAPLIQRHEPTIG
jgi:hypothetical protein